MIAAMTAAFDIGEVKVFFLGIARVRRDFDQIAEIFPGAEKGELKEAVRAVQPDGDGKYLDWYFNSVLLRIPGQTILVDTGFGFTGGGPGLGTAELLNECGVKPEQVNTVVVTHGHGDHIGGLTDEGKPSMPDARIVIANAEFEFWMGGEADSLFGTAGVAAQRSAFSICRTQIECIAMESRIAESANTTIRAIPAPGHTPGHIGIEVFSRGRRLWLMMDTIHAPFQLDHTDWSPRFDVDPKLARDTAKELLGQAAKQQIPMHLYHFPFPGIGMIKEEGPSRTYRPIKI
jgi:glyoxylase-like metal-dependent hydrolase (beta-lactamase superfamily II)